MTALQQDNCSLTRWWWNTALLKVFVKLNPGSNPYIFCAIRQMRIIFSADHSFVIFMDQAYGLGQVLFTMKSLRIFLHQAFRQQSLLSVVVADSWLLMNRSLIGSLEIFVFLSAAYWSKSVYWKTWLGSYCSTESCQNPGIARIGLAPPPPNPFQFQVFLDI